LIQTGSSVEGVDSVFGDAGNDTLDGDDNGFNEFFADILDGGTGTDVVDDKDDEDVVVNVP
jgi:hypothetical protein